MNQFTPSILVPSLLSGLFVLGCSSERSLSLPQALASEARYQAELNHMGRAVLLHPDHAEVTDSVLERAVAILGRQGFDLYNLAALPDESVALLELGEVEQTEGEFLLTVSLYFPTSERYPGSDDFVYLAWIKQVYAADCRSGSCVKVEHVAHWDISDGVHETCLGDYFDRDQQERLDCSLSSRRTLRRR
jgi:hypothetical protein